jgi:transketolase
VSAGVTLYESLAAAETLAAEGIACRVIDVYSIKPIDGATLRTAMADTGLIVTVEDHLLEGGIGDAVLSALAEDELRGRVVSIGVTDMPGSGSPEELREWAGLSAAKIAERVRAALSPR